MAAALDLVQDDLGPVTTFGPDEARHRAAILGIRVREFLLRSLLPTPIMFDPHPHGIVSAEHTPPVQPLGVVNLAAFVRGAWVFRSLDDEDGDGLFRLEAFVKRIW